MDYELYDFKQFQNRVMSFNPVLVSTNYGILNDKREGEL